MQYPSGLLTIDLSAIQANWRRLRDQLIGGAECGAVVKADAYGLGMVPVALALQRAGCDNFFVVNLAEGVLLRREIGPGPTIYVLQGIGPDSESACLAHGLVPVLVSYSMVQRWLAFWDRHQIPIAERRSAVKINTGMNRLGLEPDEALSLLSEPTILRLGCQLLMSHLACADDLAHPLNGQQTACFNRVLAHARQQAPHLQASFANSAATLQNPQWHYDLVRPGIALYGSNPTGLPQHRMQPVATLELPVIQRRQIAAGAAIGYGATYTAESERELAALAGGYGDGLFRNLGNVGEVWFNQKLPLLGRVSMDSIVADVTSLPEAQRPQEGDRVQVLGQHVDIDAVARAAGTVGYEILTRLRGRYARRYLLDGRVFDETGAR